MVSDSGVDTSNGTSTLGASAADALSGLFHSGWFWLVLFLILIALFVFWRDVIPAWLSPLGVLSGKLRACALGVLLAAIGIGAFQGVQQAHEKTKEMPSPFGRMRMSVSPKATLWQHCVEECRHRSQEGSILEIPGDDLLLAIGQKADHPYGQLAIELGERGEGLVRLLTTDQRIQTVVIVRKPGEHCWFGTEFAVDAARYLQGQWVTDKVLGARDRIPWWELTRTDLEDSPLLPMHPDPTTVYFLKRRTP